nr:hypothetical protein [Tanacetum cinerariifolium]
MIGKINLLWKTVSKKLNDTSNPENARNYITSKSIARISYVEKEELRKKGIKNPSNLFSLKYLSPASIKELNKNPSALKCVHFINSIVILNTDSDTEKEDVSSTNAHEHELGNIVRRNEEVNEQGKGWDEMETDKEVEEVFEDEESEWETEEEEVEEVFDDETKEEDYDTKHSNSLPTIKELPPPVLSPEQSQVPPVNGGQPPLDHWSMVVNGGGQRQLSMVVNHHGPPSNHRWTITGPPVNGGQDSGLERSGSGQRRVGSGSGFGSDCHVAPQEWAT